MSRRKRSKLHGRRFFNWLIAFVVVIGLGLYFWPVPTLKPASKTLKSQTIQPVSITWPNAPEAAVGAIGFGVLDKNGDQTPRPIASTAKLITALTVLQKYPLTADGQGPALTLSAADIAIYNQYSAEGGSAMPVLIGERITERQVLEGMMLPSANNLADSLAIWAFGSLAAYKIAATEYVQSLGLDQTTVGSDASGFLPDTTSTAHDLAILGQTVLANPALANIIGEKQAVLPLAGTVYNLNKLLGQDGVIGIKTGNTDQAGGVYVFGVKDNLDATHNVTVFGAIVGSDNLSDAISSAVPLINSVKQNFILSRVTTAGQIVGHYNVPWGQPATAVARQTVLTANWLGKTNKLTVTLSPLKAPGRAGKMVGQVVANPVGTISSIVLQKPIAGPPWWWRLIRHRF